MPYEVRLTIYIILVIIVFGSLALWFLYNPLRKFILNKRYKEVYFKHVDHSVKINDFYLINTFSMYLEGTQLFMIDHLVGGDKYIYVIIDYYVEGGLEIQQDQPLSYIYKKNNVKLKIANPYEVVEHTVQSLSTHTGIPKDFFIGIALINDDCEIVGIENYKSSANIVRLSKLDKFLLSKEKSDVKPIAKKKLWQTIQDLHRIKENEQSRKNSKQ